MKWYAFKLLDGRIFIKPYTNSTQLQLNMLYASTTTLDVVENIEAETPKEAEEIAKKEFKNA